MYRLLLVDRTDILRTLFGKVYETHEVREEVFRGRDEGYTFMRRAEEQIGIGTGSGWSWWALTPRLKSRACASLWRDWDLAKPLPWPCPAFAVGWC
jgi:hypothetical protein